MMDDSLQQSEFGIASSCIGAAMLVVQLAVLSAVLLGIRDNQGFIYAVSIPAVMYVFGVPIGLLASVIGFLQPRRSRRYAKLGLALTLAGPLVFALFIGVQVLWRPFG
jgi:hypothetical protein